MTFLEKALRENPQLDEQRITTYLCPSDLGYEQTPDGCTAATECIGKICGACWNRQADAAGGGESQPVCSAAVEKCEEKREPEAFFGNRKAVREADAAGGGKSQPVGEAEDRAVEDARPSGAMTGGEEAGADGV